MTKRQRNTLVQQRASQERVIAYYRVSTKKQGDSGLGLEAQKAAVAAYAASTGRMILTTYEEVESGKRSDRPQLALALAHAKRTKATLVIAKLDRLARNVEFVAHLMNAGVDFIALDLPGADRRTVHIMAAIAEGEARDISHRTKAGLAALKARGCYSTRLGRVVKLGAPEHLTEDGARKGREKAATVRAADKAEAYVHLLPIVRELREQGLSFRAIAKRLDDLGEETRTQRLWNPVQVRRVLLMEAEPADQQLPFRAAS